MDQLGLSPEEEPIGNPQEQGITGAPETGTGNDSTEPLQGVRMAMTPPEAFPKARPTARPAS